MYLTYLVGSIWGFGRLIIIEFIVSKGHWRVEWEPFSLPLTFYLLPLCLHQNTVIYI